MEAIDPTTLDIRDIDAGEVYFAIASSERGGRCMNNGCFMAVWKTRAEAKAIAAGNPDYTVVRCLKPQAAA